MAGSPPHLDMFDYKPELSRRHGQDCPQDFLRGRRFAFTSGTPKFLGTPQRFAQHGRSGAWVSEALPRLAAIVDDLTFIKSMTTDQFNHAPAELAAVHRFGAIWPAVAGLLGDVWPGLGKPKSARLHRAGLQRHLPQRRQQRLVGWLFAERLSGRAVPFAGRPGALCLQSARHGLGHAPAKPRCPARP